MNQLRTNANCSQKLALVLAIAATLSVALGGCARQAPLASHSRAPVQASQVAAAKPVVPVDSDADIAIYVDNNGKILAQETLRNCANWVINGNKKLGCKKSGGKDVMGKHDKDRKIVAWGTGSCTAPAPSVPTSLEPRGDVSEDLSPQTKKYVPKPISIPGGAVAVFYANQEKPAPYQILQTECVADRPGNKKYFEMEFEVLLDHPCSPGYCQFFFRGVPYCRKC